MSYMKRFLENVAEELGVDLMDDRALEEADRRIRSEDVLPSFDDTSDHRSFDSGDWDYSSDFRLQ